MNAFYFVGHPPGGGARLLFPNIFGQPSFPVIWDITAARIWFFVFKKLSHLDPVSDNLFVARKPYETGVIQVVIWGVR